MSGRTPPIVRDAPPEGGWDAFERTDDADALATRAALGLPTDRAIVMTGHHAEWWHPGLVAKYIAAEHLAQRHDASWSWVLVDHKAVEPSVLEAPVRDGDGVPTARRVDLNADQEIPSEAGSVRAHWRRAEAANTTARWEHAMRASLAPDVDLVPSVPASAILRTPAAIGLIERMREDPLACALAYNRAVAHTREAGVTMLHAGVDPGAIELPLWHVRDDGALGRVFAGDSDTINPDRLVPRALLLTGLARRYLCDLFIHGVGGYVYDRATERWFRDWLGVELSPMGAITADMTLALNTPMVDEGEVRRVRQYAHRARHHPALLGDSESERRKLELVRTIRGLPRASAERRSVYQRMHRELEEVRARYAVELQSFEGEALRMERLREASELARRRDWPFALFDAGARAGLRDVVVRALS